MKRTHRCGGSRSAAYRSTILSERIVSPENVCCGISNASETGPSSRRHPGAAPLSSAAVIASDTSEPPAMRGTVHSACPSERTNDAACPEAPCGISNEQLCVLRGIGSRSRSPLA
eukprot:Amastigsp_a185619_7.p4 type:complete len:115 gc:universal Amastigsp_a185619_7:66-410(+)